jgi:hypothetical protein
MAFTGSFHQAEEMQGVGGWVQVGQRRKASPLLPRRTLRYAPSFPKGLGIIRILYTPIKILVVSRLSCLLG